MKAFISVKYCPGFRVQFPLWFPLGIVYVFVNLAFLALVDSSTIYYAGTISSFMARKIYITEYRSQTRLGI